jgi:hypothetical protein
VGGPATSAAPARYVTRSVVVAALAALLIAAGGEAAAPPPGVEVSAPRAVGFADAFDYVVEATVPASEAESAELTADVGPFTVLDAEPVTRTTRRDATVILLARRLACMDDGCVGRARSLRAVLPAPVLVSASGSVTGRPTVVRVDGRVAPASARPSPDVFRADTTVPPASGTSPTKVAFALTTIAVAALLVALLLLSSLRRGSAVAGDDSLARAIRLVRESADRPEADRRRAADLLARTAGDRDRRPLAAEATRIAWAPSLPTSRTVEDLAASATRETT